MTPEQQLREVGLKVTRPRLAVLAELDRSPHADADTIFRGVQPRLDRTSRQAVYGVLAALTAAGLVRRIEPAGSAALYERRVGDNHHHLICRTCRTVVDIDCATGSAPCLDGSSGGHGFVIDEAEVTFWGTCPDCGTAQDHAIENSDR